jgi:DNA-binding XRE family transcriptional regulator
MQAHTKKHLTDDLVTLQLRVHRADVERIRRYVAGLEPADAGESITLAEFFSKHFPGETTQAVSLRGARGKEGVTQRQLAELTGIPQRHISEMEHGKRPIGKETARKLAKALNVDYRVFL